MLSVKEAAKRVGVSTALIYSWCQSGALPHYKVGRPGRRGKVLIDPDELDGFLAGMRVEGRKEPPPPAPKAKPVSLSHLRLNLG